MDKKSKEALRRYKKGRARAASSSESSSSSESETGSSSSYSSSDSERKANAARRHRKKKMARSDEERRSKREKRDHCQKKKEAKRDHLKRKLKEAKLKRKAAAAAAVLSGHSHRSSLSPLTQAKLKKLTERRHLREASKERREREKHLAREHAERSPSKMAKIRNMHADILNRQTKSPQRMHQQLMSREKIIIQTRTHEHTPSVERERGRHSEHKLHYDDRRERERERAEREALRDKERAEALARCQERQRERERIAREKQRREEEQKKYGSSGGNLERSDYDMMYHAGHPYNERERERERSLEALERTRYNTKRELDMYERECNYLESDRRSLMEEGELRHERETPRRREASPNDNERYIARVRDVREIYTEDEHERSFNRSYHNEPTSMRFPRERNANWQHGRDDREPAEYVKREPDHIVYEGHEHEAMRARERKSNNANMEWKGNWEHNEWASTPNKMPHAHARSDFNETTIKNEGCLNSETDWDVDERKDNKFGNESTNNELNNDSNKPQEPWLDNKMNVMPVLPDMHNRSNEWHNEMPPMMNSTPNFNRVRPYRERPGVNNYRQHPQPPPALMNMNVQVPRHPYHGTPRPMNKRNMTYTNPNIIKKQQAALAAAKAATQANAVAAATAVAAAKAAAQSVANSTTNPGILGQVRQYQVIGEKPEAGEIVVEEKKEVADMEKVGGGGELSEISDSDDDILTSNSAQPAEVTAVVNEETAAPEITQIASVAEETVNNVTASNEEEDMLAFEEISDGEFEEDTRLKNVADALGVDWASLIAESKAQATEKVETTSAKQRWEAHNVLLQVGVSYKLAGEEFAKNMLQHIHNKLELDAAKAKDIKCLDEKLENVKPLDLQLEKPGLLALNKPLACSQVYAHQSVKQRNEMFSNICGPYSRALSARQDLRLRRQLCGLSAADCNLTKPLPMISEKIKNLALNAFKCALEAK